MCAPARAGGEHRPVRPHATLSTPGTGATSRLTSPGRTVGSVVIGLPDRAGTVGAMTNQPVIVYCDGSALGNPGPSGWAWWVHDSRWASGGFTMGTNNIGELHAVADMLASMPVDQPLEVRCDSRYVLDAITQWMPGWKRKGWKKADGGDVKNLELMQRLDALVNARQAATTWVWVKGHSGEAGNERVDGLARAAAERARDGNTTRHQAGA